MGADKAAIVGAASSDQKAAKVAVRRIDTTEVISQKKTVLTKYLLDLLTIPEVLMSNDIVNFMDRNSVDGRAVEAEALSPLDILLAGEIVLHKVVGE